MFAAVVIISAFLILTFLRDRNVLHAVDTQGNRVSQKMGKACAKNPQSGTFLHASPNPSPVSRRELS